MLDLFTAMSLASLYICMSPIHLYGKMLTNSIDLSSEAARPMLLKFHARLLRAAERKIAKMVAVY